MSTSDVQKNVGIGTPLSMGGAVGNCIGTSGRGWASSWRPPDESRKMIRDSCPAQVRDRISKVCSKVVASRRRAAVNEESVVLETWKSYKSSRVNVVPKSVNHVQGPNGTSSSAIFPILLRVTPSQLFLLSSRFALYASFIYFYF
jgi:hypothetical protein